MKIFIVGTYEAMVRPIEDLKNKYKNCQIDYGIAMLEDGLKLAIDAKNNGYDAIISRGGTARLIKKHLDIPVIDAKPSGNDLLKSILIAKNNQTKTSIIAYSNITDGAIEIIRLLNLDFKIHYIKNDLDLTNLLIKLKEEGYQQILGDSLAIKVAKDLNFNTVLFQTGHESLENSLEYAIMILNQTQKIKRIDTIRSKFLTKFNKDYCIMQNNKIIFSQFINFKKMPISYEKCISLKYEFENKEFNTPYIQARVGEVNLEVSSIEISSDKFYLYNFKKVESDYEKPIGIYDLDIKNNFLPVTKSESMQKLFAKAKRLIKEKNPIFIIKDNEYTLNELLNFIIGINKNSTLLIDLDKINIDSYDEILKYKKKNILIKNIKDYEIISNISKKNIEERFIILLEKDSKIIDYIDEKQTLLIPNTRQRKDDLNLIFNNYIAYYHEKFATRALGMEDYIFDGENPLLNKNLDYLLKKLKNYIFTRNELIVGKDVFTKKIEEGSKKEIFDSKNLEEIEKELILYHLKKEEYNQSKVSEILGISRSTLWRKMKKYKIWIVSKWNDFFVLN